MRSRQRIPFRKERAAKVSSPLGSGHKPAESTRPQLRRHALSHYDAWREAATDVEAASRYWQAAQDEEREGAALAYFAALDREEKAAAEYKIAWRAWCRDVG
jgi:hypothetical protein